jgi:hypothetical protein
MLVADCVLRKDDSPSSRARFGGMVMGELRGEQGGEQPGQSQAECLNAWVACA